MSEQPVLQVVVSRKPVASTRPVDKNEAAAIIAFNDEGTTAAAATAAGVISVVKHNLPPAATKQQQQQQQQQRQQDNKNKQMIPISQQSTILAHRIEKTCKTVAQAMELMQPYTTNNRGGGATNTTTCSDWEDAWYATLQLCGKHRDFQQAIQIVQDYIPTSDRCRSLAIAICGRCHQIREALNLVQEDDAKTMISTPAPYNAAIAACGTNRAWKDGLRLVLEGVMPKQFINSLTCNAILTALAKSRRGDEALQFLMDGFPKLGIQRDRISYHHTIAALLAQGDRIEQACQLVLIDMQQEAQTNLDVIPNTETYDRLIAAVVAKRNSMETSRDQHAHYNSLLQQLQEASQDAPAMEATSSKKKKRKRTETADAASIKAAKRAKMSLLLNPQEAASSNSSNNNNKSNSNVLPWDFCKWDLPKRGKGKTAYWELGTIIHSSYTNNDRDNNIVVGLHPNRNPSKNGIQLWFFREEGSSNDDHDSGSGKLQQQQRQRQKLGYLLMINTPNYNHINGNDKSNEAATTSGTSQFLGLRVTDDDRRRGLAKIFVAVWLQCCLDANLQPTTGKMNKPLLCLILQHSYNFTPIPQSGGVRAKLLPPPPNNNDSNDKSNVVRLTTESSAVKNLAGAISPRDVQEQKVQFVSPTEAAAVITAGGGRPIDVGGLLEAPANQEELEKNIRQVLQDRWKLSPGILVRAHEDDSRTDTTVVADQSGAERDQRPLTMSRLFLGV